MSVCMMHMLQRACITPLTAAVLQHPAAKVLVIFTGTRVHDQRASGMGSHCQQIQAWQSAQRPSQHMLQGSHSA